MRAAAEPIGSPSSEAYLDKRYDALINPLRISFGLNLQSEADF